MTTDRIKALVGLGPELQKRYDSRSVMNPTGSILLTYEEAPTILAAIEALTPIAAGGSVVVPVEEMTMKTPVGWVGEVALSMGKNGKYTDWSEPRFSFWKPNVPEGAIRNLYPVYARLAPAAARIEALEEALKPFAEIEHSKYEPDDGPAFIEGVTQTLPTVGDLRRAARAYADKGEPT